MAANYGKFMNRQGLKPLFAADEDFKPGLIVQKEGENFWPYDDIRLLFKHEAFRKYNLSFKVKLTKADLPDSLSGRSKVGGGGKLSLPFFSVGGGLRRNKFVSFEIGRATTRKFADDRLYLWGQMQRFLRILRKQDKSFWREIRKHHIVLATWYVTEYKINLGTALAGELKAKFKRQVDVEVGADMSFDTASKIVNVYGKSRVPFAFYGKKLGDVK